MKGLWKYTLISLLMLVSCVDNSDFDPSIFVPSLNARYLSANKNAFNCPSSNSAQFSFEVTSVDTPWKFTDIISWTSLNKTEGDQTAGIYMEVEENLSGDSDRLGVFFLQSAAEDWEYSLPMTVSQPAAYAYAKPESSTLTLNGSSCSGSISVSANCTKWTVQSNVAWFRATPNETGTSFSYEIDENPEKSSRTTTVYIYLEAKKLASIFVTQKVACISMDTSTLEFENTAGAYELTLHSEASWTASTSQNWIEVNPTSGPAGESKLTVSALANSGISDRSGYVYLSIGSNVVVEIPVKQHGIYIEFDTSSLSFTSEEETKAVNIRSNTTWTISSYPDWLTISPLSGEGMQEITINASDNPNVTERSGVIKATQPGLSLEAQLTVVQVGKTFTYGDSQITCSDKAQTLKVSISTTGKWTAHTAETWLSVTPTSYTGSTQLSINVEENTTDEERTGTVTLVIGNKLFDITIVQSGKYFTVNYKENSFASTGATLSIEVTTNDSWTASFTNNPSWVTLSQTSGSGNATFTATIADNPSVNSRSASIVVSTVHNKSVKIQISQAARYLTVDHQSISFYAFGGTSEDITINTDGKYSITPSASWFSASEKGGGVFNVTASENTTKQVREGTLTIALTDLKEGTYSISMPVLQTADGASFIIIGYGDDKNWDIGASSSVSITVTGYGTDKNWDSNSQSNGLSITITGYSGDKNWDSNSQNSTSNVSSNGYSGDNNWDTSSTSSGNISYDGYSSDYNWGN